MALSRMHVGRKALTMILIIQPAIIQRIAWSKIVRCRNYTELAGQFCTVNETNTERRVDFLFYTFSPPSFRTRCFLLYF